MTLGKRRRSPRRRRPRPRVDVGSPRRAAWRQGPSLTLSEGAQHIDTSPRELSPPPPESLAGELALLLRERAPHLVTEAKASLRQARLQHYEQDGLPAMRQRLAALLDVTLECLTTGRANPLIDHTTRIAHERFQAGYDLLEVQTSMNVIEEALWRRILASVASDELVHALGLVSGLFDLGKDALSRTYVDLARQGT
jgi:hypothetical protein